MAMTSPIDRARSSLGNMQTLMDAIAEPTADLNWPDLRLERYDKYQSDGVWWYCHEAHPEMWFVQRWLDTGRKAYRDAQVQYQRALARGEITADEPEWSFFGPWCVDGNRIKLRAANGNWVWALTGITRPNPNIPPAAGDPTRSVGIPLVHQGVWPD